MGGWGAAQWELEVATSGRRRRREAEDKEKGRKNEAEGGEIARCGGGRDKEIRKEAETKRPAIGIPPRRPDTIPFILAVIHDNISQSCTKLFIYFYKIV